MFHIYSCFTPGRQVAVKTIHDEHKNVSFIGVAHTVEAAMMYQLRASGTNIVQLVGWCNTTVVVEYMPQKLEAILDNATVGQKLQWALEAARGVAQLHAVPGGPVAHLDLETKQFLLNDQGTVLLNDFNRMHICNMVGDRQCLFHEPMSGGSWRSPEEYENRLSNEKADIYSLAMVFWNMESRKEPFEGIYDEAEAPLHVIKGERPSLTAVQAYPEDMRQLIEAMWSQAPEQRPSAAQVVQLLEGIVSAWQSSFSSP
jgi:hypothetical protein